MAPTGSPMDDQKEGEMARKKETATLEDAKILDNDTLKELRDALGGGAAFHLRVKKKNPDGGFGYYGKLNPDLEDIEEEISKRWGNGHYRIYAHYNTGKSIKEVHPKDYIIGETTTGSVPYDGGGTIGGPNIGSKRLAELDEEIEAKRKQKQLLRVERELQREEYGDGMENGATRRVEELEEVIEKLSQENMGLREDYKTRMFMEKMDSLEKKLLTQTQANPETEALKLRLKELEQRERDTKLELIQKSFETQVETMRIQMDAERNKKSGIDFTTLAPIVGGLMPVLSELVKSRQNSSIQMVDAITKVGGLLTQTMPKGFDVDKIISLAPLVAKLLPKNDMSGFFDMMGSVIPSLIEAAASGSSSGDDLGSIAKQLLGTVNKAMTGGGPPPPHQFQPAFPQAPQGMAMGPQGPGVPARQMMPPQQQQAPEPQQATKSVSAIPIVRFAKNVANAIRTRNEDFKGAALAAQTTLTRDEQDRLDSIPDGASLASFLSSQPEVDSTYFSTSYAKRWLGAFLKEFKGETEGSAQVPQPQSIPKPPQPTKTAPRPEPALEPEKDEPSFQHKKPSIREIFNSNEFLYPDDSETQTIDDYGSPAGPLKLTLEFPTAETLAERERERKELAARYASPQVGFSEPEIATEQIEKPKKKRRKKDRPKTKAQADAEAQADTETDDIEVPADAEVGAA
jgi:hypothetical protein